MGLLDGGSNQNKMIRKNYYNLNDESMNSKSNILEYNGLNIDKAKEYNIILDDKPNYDYEKEKRKIIGTFYNYETKKHKIVFEFEEKNIKDIKVNTMTKEIVFITKYKREEEIESLRKLSMISLSDMYAEGREKYLEFYMLIYTNFSFDYMLMDTGKDFYYIEEIEENKSLKEIKVVLSLHKVKTDWEKTKQIIIEVTDLLSELLNMKKKYSSATKIDPKVVYKNIKVDLPLSNKEAIEMGYSTGLKIANTKNNAEFRALALKARKGKLNKEEVRKLNNFINEFNKVRGNKKGELPLFKGKTITSSGIKGAMKNPCFIIRFIKNTSDIIDLLRKINNIWNDEEFKNDEIDSLYEILHYVGTIIDESISRSSSYRGDIFTKSFEAVDDLILIAYDGIKFMDSFGKLEKNIPNISGEKGRKAFLTSTAHVYKGYSIASKRIKQIIGFGKGIENNSVIAGINREKESRKDDFIYEITLTRYQYIGEKKIEKIQLPNPDVYSIKIKSDGDNSSERMIRNRNLKITIEGEYNVGYGIYDQFWKLAFFQDDGSQYIDMDIKIYSREKKFIGQILANQMFLLDFKEEHALNFGNPKYSMVFKPLMNKYESVTYITEES